MEFLTGGKYKNCKGVLFIPGEYRAKYRSVYKDFDDYVNRKKRKFEYYRAWDDKNITQGPTIINEKFYDEKEVQFYPNATQ